MGGLCERRTESGRMRAAPTPTATAHSHYPPLYTPRKRPSDALLHHLLPTHTSERGPAWPESHRRREL